MSIVASGASFAATGNGYDRFVREASIALRRQLGDQVQHSFSQEAVSIGMQDWRLSDFAEQDLQRMGQPAHFAAGRGAIIRQWFAAQASHAGIINMSVAGGSHTGGVGKLPTLLGEAMGTIFLDPIANEEITFPEWMFKLSDVDNFNPATIATGLFAGKLDENMSGADPKKKDWGEEATWIQASNYDASLEFSYVEQENDSYDKLAQIAESGRFMCDDKMEEKAVNLLTSSISVPGPDGSTAVSVARGNLIDTADSGDPSEPQFTKMQSALRVQVDAKGNPAGSRMGLVLHSQHYETLMAQLLPETILVANGIFSPTAQSNVNVFSAGKKRLRPIYVPRLDATGKKYYYGLSVKGRAFGYAYKRGFGPGGQRRVVLNPRTLSLEFIYQQAGAVVLMVPQFITINKAGEA
jgi:hypothetical protein